MSRRDQRARRSLGRLSAVVAILVLSACASPTPGPTATPSARAPSSTSAQAIRVTVNGLTLTGHCRGVRVGRRPVVVMSLGNGQGENGMEPTQTSLARRTRVCAYNRAGVGDSSAPRTRTRPVSAVVEEMSQFLKAAKIAPPYLLIGGSAGGVVAFMFAQAHPADVAGMVLSNPMPPPYSRDVEGARRVMTATELHDIETPDYRGENPESIVFTGNDSMLTTPLPTALPYSILFDENCDGDKRFCAKVLTYLPQLEASLARVGAGGRFEWLKGAGHGIPESRPEAFAAAVDDVWSRAVRR